jgi:hypothetical protein
MVTKVTGRSLAILAGMTTALSVGCGSGSGGQGAGESTGKAKQALSNEYEAPGISIRVYAKQTGCPGDNQALFWSCGNATQCVITNYDWNWNYVDSLQLEADTPYSGPVGPGNYVWGCYAPDGTWVATTFSTNDLYFCVDGEDHPYCSPPGF